jgi:hypothetical protein
MGREERMTAQESFRHDPDVKVLLATDAAGEGINLQRAHLMVNYDLPWNPNRLEQRFGRIHRIGQTEVCHLWNLVASETREGEVYRTLLEKLDDARKALGGQVFDVLGKLQFEGKPLRELQRLGGSVKQREPRRYEVTHVSAPVRNRDRLIGIGEPVLPRYERIAFEKPLVAPPGQPLAAFVCPGHPLLDATIDLTLERHRDLLRRGAVLVDEGDFGMQPRLMLYLEHSIQDASRTFGLRVELFNL